MMERSKSLKGPGPLRLVIVDDHEFMRELVAEKLLQCAGRYQIVAEMKNAAGAIAACRAHSPDLLILDINLPGQSGLEALPEIRRVSPKTRVLLCSGSVTDKGLVAALRSGAHGFVEKTNKWTAFMEAVERVGKGENYFCARSAKVLSQIAHGLHEELASMPKTLLSRRELEVLRLIATGLSNKQVAAKLFLSVTTVDNHRSNLMKKLGVRNAVELVRHALQENLVPSSER
jgi:DNA-binding NarL/FixJ family response regulator